MTLPALAPSLMRWFATLKFKIVAMAVATGMLSALGTTELVLTTTQADINELLLHNDREDLERSAALLADKVDMLKLMLTAVARQAGPELWKDRQAMTRFMVDKPSAAALFESLIAVDPAGDVLVRLVRGVPSLEPVKVVDRPYFQAALATDQPVVSEPLLGRVTKHPLLVIAVSVRAPDGAVTGVVAGTLPLNSTSLFSNLSGTRQPDGSRNLVMDRKGVLLAHPDAARVLGQARDEHGLADIFARWHDSGSPIDTDGTAELSNQHMVSMAGIPTTDWVLVRLTPQAIAWKPMAEAQRTAWRAAAVVGLLAALLAGVLAWVVTRPISALRKRAEMMLIEPSPPIAASNAKGEVGELARAFDQVVEQRQRRQGETQALLQQLEAVLDHAEVGIALTRNGQFELVSRHFCRIFRCEKHDAVGQTTRMVHASDQAYQTFSERARPVFMEHGAFDGEVELVRRTGQAFWAHMRGRAVVPGDRSQGTIWTFEDVTQVREQRERMAWTSNHDSLTGLANRAAFEVLLERATVRAATEPFCALFIDLDRFKQVNDTGGHAAGDALLRDVAHALAAQVRASDTVARLGGDEFAVLLGRCPLPQAQLIAEKLRSAVIAYRLVWEGHSFSVGASIGLVPVDGSYLTAAEVLRAADSACYAAKRQGRNCVALHGAAEALPVA